MSETILIVDDEKEIADLVELYLKNENYHIEKAVDSETALDILEKKRIGLALLDAPGYGRVYPLQKDQGEAFVSDYYVDCKKYRYRQDKWLDAWCG